MNDAKALLSHVQAFFENYLAAQRGLSSNTILAYRDALKLFLSFLAASSGKSAARLRLEDLKAAQVVSYSAAFTAGRSGPRGTFMVDNKPNPCVAGDLCAVDSLRHPLGDGLERARQRADGNHPCDPGI